VRPDPLIGPRTAVEQGEWQVALDLLDALGLDAITAAGLELRAQAAYGNGEFEAAVHAWEELHSLFALARDDVEAARAAAMIAMYLMMDTGLMAPVRGWLRRAERLLEGHDETPAHALMAMVRTYERFMCGDMEAARCHATRAIELGDRLGVPPAVVIGRVAFARTEIYAGNVQRGLDLLDEVGVLLMSGEVDPLTTGMMYCELVCAAQGLGRFDLAREWTEVMEHWRHDAAFGGINGRCRVHRAELLRISGPCDLAEAEALGACDELRPWMRREFGWPLVELGNIRLRKGDLAGAEEAFVAAHGHAWSPHPGLALVRLAKGDTEAASALIADAIAHPFDIPSKERPPFGDLRLAPLFDAQAEIAAAAGDAETARRAAEALRSIADAYDSRVLDATASLAAARAALTSGDLERAIDDAGASVVEWTDVGAPFESAVARVVLGDAHHRSGNADRATMEWQAARSAFEEFGAAGWVERVGRLLADSSAASMPLTVRPEQAKGPTATFTCDGDTRTVSFGGRTVMMRDLKGLRYLARLLAEPGREFHVLDLVAVEQGTLPIGNPVDDRALAGEAGAGLPLIDQQAREAYRRRLAEVDEDIEEATRMNDVGRLELAQRDRDYLIAELTRSVGFGGRHRTVGSTAERARTSVTRSLRYAITRLSDHHPALAAHLEHAVHTGTYCCYTPDPLAGVVWESGPKGGASTAATSRT
jgi:tetratricopeptide (TPR) repeat protein